MNRMRHFSLKRAESEEEGLLLSCILLRLLFLFSFLYTFWHMFSINFF